MEFELYDNRGRLVTTIICPQSTELACEIYAERIGRAMLDDTFGSVEYPEPLED